MSDGASDGSNPDVISSCAISLSERFASIAEITMAATCFGVGVAMEYLLGYQISFVGAQTVISAEESFPQKGGNLPEWQGYAGFFLGIGSYISHLCGVRLREGFPRGY